MFVVELEPPTAATRLAIDAAWAAVARPMHAYPSVANDASNAVARKLDMRLLGSRQFAYPKRHWQVRRDTGPEGRHHVNR